MNKIISISKNTAMTAALICSLILCGVILRYSDSITYIIKNYYEYVAMILLIIIAFHLFYKKIYHFLYQPLLRITDKIFNNFNPDEYDFSMFNGRIEEVMNNYFSFWQSVQGTQYALIRNKTLLENDFKKAFIISIIKLKAFKNDKNLPVNRKKHLVLNYTLDNLMNLWWEEYKYIRIQPVNKVRYSVFQKDNHDTVKDHDIEEFLSENSEIIEENISTQFPKSIFCKNLIIRSKNKGNAKCHM